MENKEIAMMYSSSGRDICHVASNSCGGGDRLEAVFDCVGDSRFVGGGIDHGEGVICDGGSGVDEDSNDVDDERVKEFDRECLAAKNRLVRVEVRDVAVREVMKRGVTLTNDDLRVLATVIEEEESLDPLLGLEVDGVSMSHIRELFGYADNNNVRYRFDKLEDAGMIERHKAEDLPKLPRGGCAPVYAVATSEARSLADELALLPILRREQDLEQVVDRLVSIVSELYEAILVIGGQQGQLVKSLNESKLSEANLDFELLVDGSEAAEIGSRLYGLDMEPTFYDNTHDVNLLSEMDEMNQQMLIRMLLAEGKENA